jgi:prophage antirepressor-like protein
MSLANDNAIVYKGDTYVTLKTIADNQRKEARMAINLFRGSMDEFERGADYIEITYTEWNQATSEKRNFVQEGGRRAKIPLLTEEGAIKLATLLKAPKSEHKRAEKIDDPTSTGHQDIALFTFRGEEVRIMDEAGEPWWVAKDVCDILSIQNVTQAVQVLDDDERSMLNIGRQGKVNIINESGLYNLIFQSRKPEAKAFKRWITHEVLPELNKRGSYSVSGHSSDSARIDALEASQIRMQEVILKAVENLNRRIEGFEGSLLEISEGAAHRRFLPPPREPFHDIKGDRPRVKKSVPSGWLGRNNPLYIKTRAKWGDATNLWRKRLVGKVSFETVRRAVHEGRTNITDTHFYTICEAIGFDREEIKGIMKAYGYEDFVRMLTN